MVDYMNPNWMYKQRADANQEWKNPNPVKLDFTPPYEITAKPAPIYYDSVASSVQPCPGYALAQKLNPGLR